MTTSETRTRKLGSYHLFERGGFELHSGAVSSWRINEEVLTDQDIATLAHIAISTLDIPPFSRAVGVPRGGLRFLARPGLTLSGG